MRLMSLILKSVHIPVPFIQRQSDCEKLFTFRVHDFTSDVFIGTVQ